MGSLSDIAGMLPGVDAKALSGATVEEKALSKNRPPLFSPYDPWQSEQ
jgi:signal recognition particle subunit SRP54